MIHAHDWPTAIIPAPCAGTGTTLPWPATSTASTRYTTWRSGPLPAGMPQRVGIPSRLSRRLTRRRLSSTARQPYEGGDKHLGGGDDGEPQLFMGHPDA
ncbi:MAG: hypothetical protein ACLUEQ_01135 [Cloacibacillus evryensis]